VGCLLAFAARTNSKLQTITHTRSLCYSAPKRKQGLRLKVTEEDLGIRLGLGLRIVASTYGSTIALPETMLNLVLLTSWVSLLDNFILTVNLTDTTMKVMDTSVGTGRSRVVGLLSSINNWKLRRVGD